MRIMAIDYGDAHTGAAVSDLTGLLAGYTETIHTRRQEEVLSRLGELIGEKNGCGYCDACFTANYRTEIPRDSGKSRFEIKLSEKEKKK